jgi:hypothetical protein
MLPVKLYLLKTGRTPTAKERNLNNVLAFSMNATKSLLHIL